MVADDPLVGVGALLRGVVAGELQQGGDGAVGGEGEGRRVPGAAEGGHPAGGRGHLAGGRV